MNDQPRSEVHEHGTRQSGARLLLRSAAGRCAGRTLISTRRSGGRGGMTKGETMSNLDLHEVKAYWESLPEHLSREEQMRALAARFPTLTVGDIGKIAALTIAEGAELIAEGERQKYITSVAKRHMHHSGELLIDVLRRGAEAGDLESAAIVRAWEAQLASPEHRAFRRLFEAAIDAHPTWSRLDQPAHYACPPPDHPEHEDKALVAWFERTRPAEAARITAEALAN